jgi:hypothetical protein
MWRLRHGRTRHVAAAQPAELVCLDTFYIGQLTVVGKVWQVTACDAASSFGIARIPPALSPTATARALRDVVVPTARRAGWRVQRVLTDAAMNSSGVRLPCPGANTGLDLLRCRRRGWLSSCTTPAA